MKDYYTDMHCHILPHIDDGASTMQEALDMLRLEYKQGVRSVLLTPHYRRGYFETARETVQEQFERLRRCAVEKKIDVELYLGCEFYRMDQMQERLALDDRYRINGTRYILLEFSPEDLADTIWRYTVDLLIGGYRPVIAHAERYQAIKDIRLVRKLTDAGAYIQINAGSIIGRNGWSAKRLCRKLLKEELVHLVGSDAHGIGERSPCIGPCAAYMMKKVGPEMTRSLLTDNPHAVLTGRDCLKVY